MKKEKEYKAYLENKFAEDKHVNHHINNVNYFDDWLKQNLMPDIIQCTTPVIMTYIKHLQDTSIKVGTINNRLNSLRKYYHCIMTLGYITRNPASNLFIKGAVEKVVINPLSATFLNDLYMRFETFLDTKPKPKRITALADNHTKQRYKLIISLIIYQALDTGELDKLNVTDIDMKKNTIYIAGRKRRQARELPLDSKQIISFYHYIQSLPSHQEKLFNLNVQQITNHILGYLKGVEPQVKNAEHIRQSRIMDWVSTLKLREAQIKIGHKYVSSTEGYQQQNTTELVDEINTLHLFR